MDFRLFLDIRLPARALMLCCSYLSLQGIQGINLRNRIEDEGFTDIFGVCIGRIFQ